MSARPCECETLKESPPPASEGLPSAPYSKASSRGSRPRAAPRSRRRTERVTVSGDLENAWPVGTRAQSGAQELAPGLLEFINVEIVDQPLDDTLNVIQQRLKIPFLYDHNALARHEVDLHASVSLPRTRTFYKKILDQLLFQKLLRCELRTDDAGKPFVWITSAKR